jgi:hypothetical protein
MRKGAFKRPISLVGCGLTLAGSWGAARHHTKHTGARVAGTLLRVTSHFFYTSPCGSMINGASEPTGSVSWKEGKQYSTRVYDSNFTELTRVDCDWRQRPSVTGEQHPTMPSDMLSPNNPRVVETITTIEPSTANLTSQVSFDRCVTQPTGSDQFNNPTDVCEYDFNDVSGWTLKRRPHAVSTTDPRYINAHFDPDLGARLRGLATPQQLFDSSGAERGEYDNYTTTSLNVLLQPRTNITELCTDAVSPTEYANTDARAGVKSRS